MNTQWLIMAGLVVAILALVWLALFSRRATERRRHRGSYGRVRDRRHGPAVQLNSKTKDPKRP